MEHAVEWMKDPTLGRLIIAGIVLVIVFGITRITQKAASRYVTEKNSRYRVRKFISFFGYVAAALALTTVYSDRLGQVSVVFGVAGAGIAFALQEVIASIAGWGAISFGGFYSVGDRVQLGGIKGDVVDIGILRTTLAEVGQWVNGDLYNGRMVRVANSFVFKEPVVNYSGDFPFLWDEVTFPIRLGSDLEVAEGIIASVGRDVCSEYEQEASVIWAEMSAKYPVEKVSTSPMVTYGFDENWVTFTLRYPVRFDKRRSTKHRISAGVLSGIQASEGAVSVASAAIEVIPMSPLELKGLREEKA